MSAPAKPGLRENLAGLRPIRGLLTTVTVSRCAVVLYPFYGVYLARQEYGLTADLIGLVVGAFGIGALLAGVFAGALTARLPEQRVAVTGFLGVAVLAAVISFTTELWVLAALTVVWGFCYELVNPIAYTLVSRVMPEESRRFAFSAVRLAINAGMGIGPVLAGLLFSVDPELLPWGTAVGYLLSAFLLARTKIAGAAASRSQEPAAGTAGDGGPDRSGRRFWTFLAATTPIHLAYALPSTVGSVYVIHVLGASPGWASAIFAVNSVLVITCEIALNHAMLTLTRRTTLLIGYAAATLGFVLMGLGHYATWLLLLATAVWTVGEMIVYPVMPDHISAVTPERQKTRNMGFYTAHYNLGVVLAPLIFLPLLEGIGPVVAWSLVGAVLLLGLVATAVISASPRTWGVDQRAVPAPAPVVADQPVPVLVQQ